jgi:hypothetical protein
LAKALSLNLSPIADAATATLNSSKALASVGSVLSNVIHDLEDGKFK